MIEKKKLLRRAIHDRQNPYLQFKRTTAQDKKLSYEARGMLAYILSQKDEWVVQPSELIIDFCGRDKVYRILKELIESYYIEHEKSFNEQHKIVWGDYIVHEYPFTENPDTENQEMDLGEKPYPENPDTENPDSNKYGNRKEVSSTRRRSPSAVTPEMHPYIEAWVTVRGIDTVNIGAPVFSSKDTTLAKKMAKWTVPPTREEIETAIKSSKVKDYPFMWLEADIPKIRMKDVKQPIQQDNRVYQDVSAAAALKGVKLL